MRRADSLNKEMSKVKFRLKVVSAPIKFRTSRRKIRRLFSGHKADRQKIYNEVEMDAQKIIDEIGVFLNRSLLKKSKITKAEIIRFIEAKWAEADDEKNRVYASYIYAARMVNEHKWA